MTRARRRACVSGRAVLEVWWEGRSWGLRGLRFFLEQESLIAGYRQVEVDQCSGSRQGSAGTIHPFTRASVHARIDARVEWEFGREDPRAELGRVHRDLAAWFWVVAGPSRRKGIRRDENLGASVV